MGYSKMTMALKIYLIALLSLSSIAFSNPSVAAIQRNFDITAPNGHIAKKRRPQSTPQLSESQRQTATLLGKVSTFGTTISIG
jgi:hypothetical protein